MAGMSATRHRVATSISCGMTKRLFDCHPCQAAGALHRLQSPLNRLWVTPPEIVIGLS
jgi:hypothetical protein